LPESYVWALTPGSHGELYLAAGSPAAVYKVTGRLTATRLAVLPAANALDVVMNDDGTLLVATQGPGLIYRIDPDAPEIPRVLYEPAQEEVRQFARGPEGDWYALAMTRKSESDAQNTNDQTVDVEMMNGSLGGSTTNGEQTPPELVGIYRIDSEGLVRQVWGGNATLLAMVHHPHWGWLAAGVQEKEQPEAALFVLEPPIQSRPVATWDAGDILDLIVLAAKGQEALVVCQAHPGRIVKLEDRPTSLATAISEPIDGGLPIHWGRLHWQGQVPPDGRFRWSVRGGARSVPDETWTEWSDSWTDQDHSIPLAPSRFLQWRVQMEGARAGAYIAQVTVSGFEPNSPPQILQFQLERAGEIYLGGLLSREENVTETFPSGLRAEYSISSRNDRRAGIYRAAPVRSLRTFTWLVFDPNEDRLEFRLAYQRLGDETWRPVGPAGSEFLRSWDTATVPDGDYVVRLVASDRPDNPASQALSSQQLSPPFTVDNTPPEVEKFKATRTEQGFTISLQVRDRTSALAEAWLELPDGTRERLDPVDSICDSHTEKFDAQFSFPQVDQLAPPEPWRVRVEIADRLGNVVSQEGEVR